MSTSTRYALLLFVVAFGGCIACMALALVIPAPFAVACVGLWYYISHHWLQEMRCPACSASLYPENPFRPFFERDYWHWGVPVICIRCSQDLRVRLARVCGTEPVAPHEPPPRLPAGDAQAPEGGGR